jgi:D-glycero-D-manno-heptose 1,7-bisphosphate phosphatase
LKKLSAVFFDRDGVLIQTPIIDGSPVASNTLNEIEFVPGAIEICKWLFDRGVPCFLVTNQPDVSRGKVELSAVTTINQLVAESCFLTGVAMCVHDNEDSCECRKPKPGMLIELAQQHSLDLHGSIMVGDRWRDVNAGAAAGCRTIFIDYRYGERLKAEPTYKADSMADVGLILKKLFVQ